MSLIPRQSIFDIDRFFNDFWGSRGGELESPEGMLVPRIDVKDNDDHIEISAELPGVKKEDIHIGLEDGLLTLSAESHQEDKEEKDGKLIRQERRYGKYMRSFNVGKAVQDSDIKASFDDGILKLTAPKKADPAPSSHRIEVQ